MALLALPAGWLYSRNSLFRLSNIIVNSEDSDFSKRVQENLLAHLGRNQMVVSLSDLEKQVRSFPAIENVGIRRHWPDTVVIDVQLRTPIALIFHEQKIWQVDAEGEFISMLSAPLGLPLLKNFKLESAGKSRKAVQHERREVFNWLSKIKNESTAGSLFRSIDELEWNETSGLIVRGQDLGTEIELGFHDYEAGWRRGLKVLEHLKAKNLPVAQLDASYPNRVIARKVRDLQNFQNGLNLEELVRRKVEGAPGVR